MEQILKGSSRSAVAPGAETSLLRDPASHETLIGRHRRHGRLPQLVSIVKRLKNPITLVVITWVIMAALLMHEIVVR